MEEWKEYKLSEVATLTTGFPFDGHKYGKEGIRVVRGDNVTIGSLRWDTDKDKRWNESFDRASEFSLSADDIVIGMDGSRVGRNRAQIKQEDLPLYIAQRVACIRHNELSLQSFLYYQIFSQAFEKYIKAVHTGTSIPHVSLKQIGDYPIYLPSLKVQQRIASILSSLDDKIEVNRRINENLEAQAQALFKSWFVDFEPFKDGEFVESELGMIPKGWRVYCLSEFLPVITGKKDANVATGGIYPFFSCSQDYGWTDDYSFEGKAILVAGNGDFNVKMYNGKFEAYQRTYVLIPHNPQYTAWLFYAVKYHLNDITSAARGSVIKFITKGNLADFKFPAPTRIEKSDVIDKFDNIRELIASNELESHRLATLRDTLLPRLMSGELKVNEIGL